MMIAILLSLWVVAMSGSLIYAQNDDGSTSEADEASVTATVGGESGGKLIIEATGVQPKTKALYKAHAETTVRVDASSVQQGIAVTCSILQGKPEVLLFTLTGSGVVSNVTGEAITAWAERREGDARFLEVRLKPGTTGDVAFNVATENKIEVPAAETNVLMLGAGEAVAYSSAINVQSDLAVEVKAVRADGLFPVAHVANADAGDGKLQFQSTGDATLILSVLRSGTMRAPVELVDVSLEGTVDTALKSSLFTLKGKAIVTPESGGRVRVLSGRAALTEVLNFEGFHIALNGDAYELAFASAGEFTFEIPLAAAVLTSNEWRGVDFQVGAGTIVPVAVAGLGEQVEFDKKSAVVPTLRDGKWQGFLPANGSCRLAWKPLGESDAGKLFFSTEGRIDARVEAGLLRQVADITLTVLQGELPEVTLTAEGPGEIVSVEGTNVTGWEIADAADGARTISIRLSRPLEKAGRLIVRSQTPLGEFPARVAALRLTPEGSVRHSGYVRLSNGGAVRIDLAGVQGMSQTAPEQFPGEALQAARQVLAYRFPGAAYAFEVLADQILPEVGVSQVTVYQVTETDRILSSQIELDIREAPLRDWTLRIPDGYSVVEVTGAEVADYALDSLVEAGARNLKVLFRNEVSGRQLIQLRLEQNTPAAAGLQVLPPLAFPGAKSVRGQIGVAPAPGFRAVPDPAAITNLSELPLTSFQNRVNGLQLAYRVREADWTASVTMEALGQNVQTDVFHLYLLKEGIVYGSIVVDYFIVGSPVSQYRLNVPTDIGNLAVDGSDVQGWRREADEVIVDLHQPVLGQSTVLVTFELPMNADGGVLPLGGVQPTGVQGERGYIQVVSPSHVKYEVTTASPGLLKLDAIELPAETRLLSSAPTLAAYQYSARPFTLSMNVAWFERGETVGQIVEFARLDSQIARDGEIITTARYFVKTRQGQTLRVRLPDGVRLWDAKVNGQTVSVRIETEANTANGASGSYLLIPISSSAGTAADPGSAVEVAIRIGHKSSDNEMPVLLSPAVDAPGLIAEWHVKADEGRRLLPDESAGLSIGRSPLPKSGYTALTGRRLLPTIVLISFGVLVAFLLQRNARPNGVRHILGFLVLVLAMGGAGLLAFDQLDRPVVVASEFNVSFTATGADQVLTVPLHNVPLWKALVSWTGVVEVIAGLVLLMIGLKSGRRASACCNGWALAGLLAVSAGLLTQPGGAAWFLAWMGLVLLLVVIQQVRTWPRLPKDPTPPEAPDAPSGTTATAAIVIAGLLALGFGTTTEQAHAADSRGADSIVQQWEINDGRLTATATITLTAREGDTFEILRSPATLTSFEGQGLQLRKREVSGVAVYLLVPESAGTFTGIATYELPVDLAQGLTLPTGAAAVQSVEVKVAQAGWRFSSTEAVRIEPIEAGEGASAARLVLRPGRSAGIAFQLAGRDIDAEETRYFAETQNAFICGPGVVDARHHVVVRPSQGKVSRMSLSVPTGFTVSSVNGPVGQWRFDPDSRALTVDIEPAQSSAFQLLIESQMTTGTLPVNVNLQALTVNGAASQVGKLGLAFTTDAQPEAVVPGTLSPVNITDFSLSLGNDKRGAGDQVALRNVYRHGEEGGAVALTVAPVNSEVRVEGRQVLSLGEERLVLAIDLDVDITRAGLFRLTLPLPDGFDIEGVSGSALSHWTEATEDGGQRVATLHLNGRTLGRQTFAISLSAPSPGAQDNWPVPRVQVREATRQAGQLTVTPERGIRIRPESRQNASQLDSRELSANQPGTLAFRLLQADWQVVLDVEKLDSWVTARSLQEVTLREGVTQTRLAIRYVIENAGVKTVRLTLPGLTAEEQNSVRASGKDVSEIVKVSGVANAWDVQFRRSVLGETDVQIEYQTASQHAGNGTESIAVPVLDGVRQSTAYVAVRVSGRLDLLAPAFPGGWQAVDWIAVPEELHTPSDTSVPALVTRVSEPAAPLGLSVRRHAVADSLKLRVQQGRITTVLGTSGSAVTEAKFDVEVVEQSTLEMKLPIGARLFSVFVNDQSVNTVVEGDAYRFHVKAREDSPTANIRMTWSMALGGAADQWKLVGPELGVPVENISWRVVVPKGFEFDFKNGSLQEVEGQAGIQVFTLSQYEEGRRSRKVVQEKEAIDLLNRANTYLKKGEQEKARSVLQMASESSALDDASNEDARVQLRELQNSQAVVGLNTIRQRSYLNNGFSVEDFGFQRNEQFEQSASQNPLMRGTLNYDPSQVDQLLAGNSAQVTSALKRMADRIVSQQDAAEPASQAIQSQLPEHGRIYTFARSVQVAGGDPLELNFSITRTEEPNLWNVVGMLVGVTLLFGCVLDARVRRA
ncbi:MAG: hypothetical protein KDN22_21875 [Verrucomicrobiae bacterium]|nr:hypothetical protein [Verrucomicrobiae bacterium]